MDFLSLNESPAPRAPRVTRAEAIGLSLLAHALILLLFVEGDRIIPETLRQWLARQDATRAAARPPDAVPPADAPVLAQPRQPESRKMPVRFAYVKVPDDTRREKNPLAPLLSDRDRRARQEQPTPADARNLGPDPHSKGDTIDRVRPDPNVPEGPDAEEPIGPEQRPKRDEKSAVAEGPEEGEGRGAGVPGSGAGDPSQLGDDATIARGEPTPPPGAVGGAAPTGGSQAPSGGPSVIGSDRPGSGGGTRSTPNLKPGTEYKFQFNNQGWLRDQAYGTMSFDTQGFPWGDYARKLQVAIVNSVRERLPLAWREGQSGYTCQHFTIARDGTVGEIEVLHPSAVPPFTRTATDGIRAASKVPPLPNDFPKDSEGVIFCFYFNMYRGEAE